MNLTDKIRFWVKRLAPHLGIIFIFVLSVRNIFDKTLAYSDFTPFSSQSGLTIARYFYLWNNNYIGYFDPGSISYIIRWIFEYLSLGRTNIAQTAYILSFLLLAFYGMAYFLKRFKISLLIRLFIAFCFVFNPVTATELSNGAVGLLILYALIPLLTSVFLDLIERIDIKKGIVLSIIIAFFCLNPQSSFWILIELPILFFVSLFFGYRLKIKNVLYIFFQSIVGVLLNSTFFFNVFNVRENFTKISYLQDFNHNYHLTQLVHLLRLTGNNGSSQGNLGYFDISFFNVAAFLAPLLICIGTVFFLRNIKEKRSKTLVVTALLSMFFSMAFMAAVRYGYLEAYIIKNNVLLASARNPQKVFYAFAFNYCLLLAWFFQVFKDRYFLKHKKKVYLLLCVFIMVWVGQNKHFISGDFGLSKTRGEGAYYIEDKYQWLTTTLSSLREGHVMYLPFDYNVQLKTVWDKNLVKLKMGGQMSGAGLMNSRLSDVYSLICSRDYSFLGQLLGVRYIVLDKKPISYQKHESVACSQESLYGTPYIWGDFSFFNKIFANEKVLLENENFKIIDLKQKFDPMIYSLESVYSTPEKNVDEINDFINTKLRKRFIITDKPANIAGLITVKALFNKENIESVKSNHLLSKEPLHIADSRKYSIFRNNHLVELSLSSYRSRIVPDIAVKSELFQDAEPLKFNTSYLSNTSTRGEYGKRYFIDNGSNIFRLNAKPVSLGFTNSYTLLTDEKNSILNPSFENGPWQLKVSNCNKVDDNPVLGMSLDRTSKTDGRQSLRLEATRHTACVSTNIPITEPGDYAFTFDYQSPNAQKASFYLQFNDAKKTVVRETIGIENADWNTYTRKITIPSGATSTKLYFYSYSIDDKTNVITRYDNVHFGKLKPVTTITLPKTEGYEKIPVALKAGENTFEYKDPRYTYKNLFPNPSFETGMWQPNVGDCNRYDENPLISMTTTTQEKTDGQQALELSATRHTACTLTTLPVKSGSTYLVSFDYQSPNAKAANYFIGFNDPEKSSIKDDLPITGKAWQTFSDTITVPKGATSLYLYIYAKETDKKTKIINRYDNFKLIEVPDLRDAFYLVSEPTSTFVEPKSITFDLINPTKKQVHIKGATTPFFLGMSESYHDQWQLQVRNAKIQGWLNGWWPFAKPDRVGDVYHYKLDGFLNAWYVDTNELCVKQAKCTQNADGSYDLEMTIEFWPQRWFYLGLLISGTTLVGCLGYLAFDGVRTLRRKRKERHTTV